MPEISKSTAEALSRAGKQNPANDRVVRVEDPVYIPMSARNSRLAVPEIPGFYLYWFLGKNTRYALTKHWSFVEQGEVELDEDGVANDTKGDGNTDLGTRISRAANKSGADDERLYLMKLPLELWEQGQKYLGDQNEEIARALRAGNIGAGEDPDRNRRYMKQGQDLFYPKVRKQ